MVGQSVGGRRDVRRPNLERARVRVTQVPFRLAPPATLRLPPGPPRSVAAKNNQTSYFSAGWSARAFNARVRHDFNVRKSGGTVYRARAFAVNPEAHAFASSSALMLPADVYDGRARKTVPKIRRSPAWLCDQTVVRYLLAYYWSSSAGTRTAAYSLFFRVDAGKK